MTSQANPTQTERISVRDLKPGDRLFTRLRKGETPTADSFTETVDWVSTSPTTGWLNVAYCSPLGTFWSCYEVAPGDDFTVRIATRPQTQE